MTDSRRNFIKRLTVASAATVALPQALTATERFIASRAFSGNPKTILFQGDSITDGGRSFDNDHNHIYGQGYMFMITGRVNCDAPQNNCTFINRGISGNTVADLAARWQKDTLDLKPDVLSILAGINDVYHVIVNGKTATPDDFRREYDALLARTMQALPDVKLVLCEPFILPVGRVKNDLDRWTAEVDKRRPIVKELAEKYQAVFVPFQEAFNKAAAKAPAEHWIWDGIHPMPAGHELMARTWLKHVTKKQRLF